MTPFETLILATYFFILIILAGYGWHRYYLVYAYVKNRDKVPVPAGRFDTLPMVTMQLPIYNEMYVVDRLIEAVCRMDYPRELRDAGPGRLDRRDAHRSPSWRCGVPRRRASTSPICTGRTARATRPARSRPG